jgi:N-acetylglucosaminyldiphosphoundecaprenol N-acetyl-beta-D-mannosaminyltransferase
VLGCEIDRFDMERTVSRCREAIGGGEKIRQASINAAKVVAMRDDPALRRAIEGCELVNADGQSVVWASRLLGDPLPERVAGIDLMHRLLDLAEREAHGVYVLGARQDVLERAIGRLRERHPRLRIAGYRDGYFPEEQSGDVTLWLAEHGEHLGVPVAMGVGGAIDVVAGVARRAPRLWQRLGLEWLYRLAQEPRRLFGRYTRTNLRFLALLLGALPGRFVEGRGRATGNRSWSE